MPGFPQIGRPLQGGELARQAAAEIHDACAAASIGLSLPVMSPAHSTGVPCSSGPVPSTPPTRPRAWPIALPAVRLPRPRSFARHNAAKPRPPCGSSNGPCDARGRRPGFRPAVLRQPARLASPGASALLSFPWVPHCESVVRVRYYNDSPFMRCAQATHPSSAPRIPVSRYSLMNLGPPVPPVSRAFRRFRPLRRARPSAPTRRRRPRATRSEPVPASS